MFDIPRKIATVIEPRRKLRLIPVGELWEYRELTRVLAARDIAVRYKHTAIGVGWALLRPALYMIVLGLVFGHLARMPSQGVPYPIFLLSGLLPWMFFAQAVASASGSMAGAGNLITKVYFPRLIVPLASVSVAFVDLLISLGILLPLAFLYAGLHAAVVLLPLVILVALVVALGFGILFSAISVQYRDFRQIEAVILQLWMFGTPVVYPLSVIPERWRPYSYLNPMTGVVEAFRSSVLGFAVDWGGVAMSFGIALAILFVALLYFDKVERKVADIL